jgi:hypothetical protein
MFKRKSKADLQRERIEEREFVRRVREGGPQAAAIAQVEQLERKAIPEPGPCSKHPQWNPRRTGIALVQPWPSARECPECAQERARIAQARRTYVTVESPHYGTSRFTSYQIRRAKEVHEAKMRASGQPLPGSPEEEEALRRIDALRRRDLAKNADTPEARRARAATWWGRQSRSKVLGLS